MKKIMIALGIIISIGIIASLISLAKSGTSDHIYAEDDQVEAFIKAGAYSGASGPSSEISKQHQ